MLVKPVRFTPLGLGAAVTLDWCFSTKGWTSRAKESPSAWAGSPETTRIRPVIIRHGGRPNTQRMGTPAWRPGFNRPDPAGSAVAIR